AIVDQDHLARAFVRRADLLAAADRIAEHMLGEARAVDVEVEVRADRLDLREERRVATNGFREGSSDLRRRLSPILREREAGKGPVAHLELRRAREAACDGLAGEPGVALEAREDLFVER